MLTAPAFVMSPQLYVPLCPVLVSTFASSFKACRLRLACHPSAQGCTDYDRWPVQTEQYEVTYCNRCAWVGTASGWTRHRDGSRGLLPYKRPVCGQDGSRRLRRTARLHASGLPLMSLSCRARAVGRSRPNHRCSVACFVSLQPRKYVARCPWSGPAAVPRTLTHAQPS